MGLFDSLFTNDDAKNAAAAKTAGLNAGYGQASDLYGQGRDALTSGYSSATQPLNTVFGNSQAGTTQYANALGLNGAAGNAAAIAGFQNNPGLQSQLDMGTQAIDRGAAARGQLNSGNTLQAEQQYGQNLGNQSYQQYVQNLAPYNTQATQAATGLGALGGAEASSLNNSYGNQGNLAYQTQTGIGSANASADLANGQAASNLFSGLGLGANMLGFSNGGLGSALSGIAGAFL